MSDHFLSRARVRRDVPSSALRELFVPSGDSERTAAGHKLVWTLFADSPGRERDFLWREGRPGDFYVLSRRPPDDRHGLFELDAPKPFAPVLREGDRLAFALRANATVSRGGAPGVRGKRCDVVMDAIHATPRGERAEARRDAIIEAGLGWIARQGEKSGFILPRGEPSLREGAESVDRDQSVRVMGYRTLRISHGRVPAQLGILDFEGVLEVREPEVFVSALTGGFGRAKAFGCGLMLVRRI
jgi:CRISPR system Cascade subunit CasE